MWGSRDPLLEFWDPPNISGTVKARNFKCGTEMDGTVYPREKCKIMSKGVMWGSCDPLLEFWDPQISSGQMKLETSNLAQRWTAVSTNDKMQN